LNLSRATSTLTSISLADFAKAFIETKTNEKQRNSIPAKNKIFLFIRVPPVEIKMNKLLSPDRSVSGLCDKMVYYDYMYSMPFLQGPNN
jgi:hypothetical protein